MYRKPELSPWGRVQTCDVLCPGVFMVSTASHGGTMVARELAAVLSPAARKCGFRHGRYFCFEEDNQEAVSYTHLDVYKRQVGGHQAPGSAAGYRGTGFFY